MRVSKFLFAACVALPGLLFGGYWLAGSTAVDRGVSVLIDTLRLQGWSVSYDQIRTAGFPARFDTQLVDVAIADPSGLFGWRGADLRVYAPSYWPTTITAILPDSQSVILPDQHLVLNGTDMGGRFSVHPSTALPVAEITLQSQALRVVSDQGWDLALDGFSANFTDTNTDPLHYDLRAEVTGIALPAALLGQLNPDRHLPAVVDHLQLDLGLSFDRPLDRYAGQGEGPQLQSLSLRQFEIVWGDVSLSASGEMTIDPTGAPEGKITVIGTNWQQLFAMAVGMGLLSADVAPSWERGVAALAQGSNQINAPISFENGFMSLGPIPLGPAPRF